tara:strand:- start:326 stop:502 length:177 start_codon:yes stop_codon:yes gene_type:complete
MAEFLDTFLNPPEIPGQNNLNSRGPGLTRQDLMLKGKPSKEYKNAVEERDKEMKNMST